MYKGIGNLFNHGLVDLGLFSYPGEMNLFAAFIGKIVDQPDHLSKNTGDRDHPYAHGNLLEFAGDPFKVMRCFFKILKLIALKVRIIGDHGLGYDQFAYKVDQVVEFIQIYPDVAAGYFFAS